MITNTDDPAVFRFCVVVHDVSPIFQAEIGQLLHALEPLVPDCLVGAVVPQWHGEKTSALDRKLFENWAARFGELLLHGWTHYREAQRGIVSWCTGAADEFEGLSLSETLKRLAKAQALSADLFGRPLRGFVPPAWRFAANLADIQVVGIEYLMRFRWIESLGRRHLPLATWSWDWGWLPGAHLPGAAMGTWFRWLDPRAVPTVVVHPHDVGRGHLPTIQRFIRRLLSAKLSPVLPSHLLSSVS